MASSRKKKAMGPEPTRLRQIALVAEDLERARHLLTTVLGTEVIYEDPAVAHWGLRNILVPLGGEIIEVVSPFRPSTTVFRYLAKHGDGGYMLIMQSHSALARRNYLVFNNLAMVIFSHSLPDSICVQYHPKGIKGGVMPELDSYSLRDGVEDGVKERFAPWHALGPISGWERHREVMRRYAHLWLLGVKVRLGEGDADVEGAAGQWEELFGVTRVGIGELRFENAGMGFLAGEEGLWGIVVGVEGWKGQRVYFRGREWRG